MPISNPSGGASILKYQDGTVPVGNTIANQSGSDVAFTSSYTIAANTLIVGNVIRINLQGIYGTNIVAPTITGKIKFGATTMVSTGAVSSIAGVTNGGWTGYADFIVTAIGAGGTVESQGFLEFSTAATTALTVNLANTAAIALDTTAEKIITVTVNWGTSNAANTITLRTMTVEILKT